MLSSLLETISVFIQRFPRFLRVALVSASALAAAGANAQIYVDGAEGLTIAQGADGTDWAHAFKYLQDAIPTSAPISPVQIWVRSRDDFGATLTYYPDEGATQTNNARASSFTLRNNVAIYSGFTTGSETALSQRDLTKQAILSGDLEKDFSSSDPWAASDLADNAYNVVTSPDGVNNTARLDTIRIVSGNDSSPTGSGGGLYCNLSGPMVVRCTFEYNQVVPNADTEGGGAVYLLNPTATMPPTAPIRMVSCSLINNRAIAPASGDPPVLNGDAQGGAVAQYGGKIEFANCVFRGNHVIVGETDTGKGGAIYLYDDDRADCYLYNCTLYQNDAEAGPTAYLDGPVAGFLYVFNSIVWNDLSIVPLDGTQTNVEVTYSDIEDGYTGTGNIDEEPVLNLALGYDTIPPDYGTSPCLNKASATDLPVDFADVDGDANTTEALPRDRSHGTRVLKCLDMGAYEQQVAPTAGCVADVIGPGNSVPDGEVNIDDLLYVINFWGVHGGAADMYDPDCGDGIVDVDDLLAVINSWGECGNPSSLPESIEDCWDMAYQECGGETDGECFETTYSSCIRYLCAEEIIECPEE
jgi:hypothetical protein